MQYISTCQCPLWSFLLFIYCPWGHWYNHVTLLRHITFQGKKGRRCTFLRVLDFAAPAQTSWDLQSPVPDSQNCIWEYLYNVSSTALAFSKPWPHWFHEMVISLQHGLHSLSSCFPPKYLIFFWCYSQGEFCYCTFKDRKSGWFSLLLASRHHSFEDILSHFGDSTHQASKWNFFFHLMETEILFFFFYFAATKMSNFILSQPTCIHKQQLTKYRVWEHLGYFCVCHRVHGTKATYCLHRCTSQ